MLSTMINIRKLLEQLNVPTHSDLRWRRHLPLYFTKNQLLRWILSSADE